MSTPPTNESSDPILDEIHATRKRLIQEHGGIAGLAEFLRREESKSNWPKAELPVRSNPAPAGGPKVEQSANQS